MWQALRNELRNALHSKGFELVTVGLDALGSDGCGAFIEAAKPEHPSLIDRHHVMAEHFGITNIPQSVWIDEQGRIVRPAETAPAPQRDDAQPRFSLPPETPPRVVEMMGEAMKIRHDSAAYHAALRDWVEKGAASKFVLSETEVIARSRPRDGNVSLGHAHFQLATQLEVEGHHAAAVRHFREAHRLVPDSWTFRRQAWSLEKEGDGPLARFWQGPKAEDPASWPYAGDWLSDVKREGAENYNAPFVP